MLLPRPARLGHFPEHSDIDPRIDRRCLRGLMTQQGADDFQRRVVAQQIGRRGMPEDMSRRQTLSLDAGPLDRSLRDRRHTTAGQGLMERRHHAQEHFLGIHDRSGTEDVILDRGADVLRQRQDRGAARFAADPNDGLVPVDIVQPKIGDIAGTQGEPGEEPAGWRDPAVPWASPGRRMRMMRSMSSRGR